MHPDISEFSYGYALTEELIHSKSLPLKAAPLFPSLIAEGRTGGGFDVKLPFVGYPLFLQFKLAHCMVRASTPESKFAGMLPQFYRMHLRPSRHSRQHELLLDLEQSGEMVYYAAPHFHKPDELNDAYLEKKMVAKSFFAKPSKIGPLPDDKDHHVSFQAGFGALVCSTEPRMIYDESPFRQGFESDLVSGLQTRQRLNGSSDGLARLANQMMALVKERVSKSDLRPNQREILESRPSRFQIAYLARTFFACEMLLVGDNDHQKPNQAFKPTARKPPRAAA